MKISYLAGMNVSESALTAQRVAMNTAAENLANAQTTKTETGDPYRRKVVSLATAAIPFTQSLEEGIAAEPLTRTNAAHMNAPVQSPSSVEGTAAGVSAQVVEDRSDFPQIYDPGHPDADEHGMVRMPNVETAQEMVAMMTASRAYEANIAALQAAKKLADASLNLAR